MLKENFIDAVIKVMIIYRKIVNFSKKKYLNFIFTLNFKKFKYVKSIKIIITLLSKFNFLVKISKTLITC